MKPLLRCSFAIVVVFILSMMAQATTVTGTLVDSSGQVLINTKIHIEFQGPPGIPGSPTITPVDVQTDSNGGFTTTLTGNDTITPSRSTYTFTICPNATVPCSVIRQVSITGTSIDISSVLNAGISPTIINAQTLVPKAYKDTEVPVVDLTNIGAMYWNVVDKSIHLWDGTVWTALLSASALLSQTLPQNLVTAGDSITNGNQVLIGDEWPSQVMNLPMFRERGTLTNTAVVGYTCSNMTNDYVTKVKILRPAITGITTLHSTLIGRNDIAAGTSAATLESCISNYWATARADGFKTIAFTLYDTTGMNAAAETQRANYNTWLRNNRSLFDYFVDLDVAFPNFTDTTLISDQIHPTARGHNLIANLVNAAVGGVNNFPTSARTELQATNIVRAPTISAEPNTTSAGNIFSYNLTTAMNRSSYERGVMFWNANIFEIGTEMSDASGFGLQLRTMRLKGLSIKISTGGTDYFEFRGSANNGSLYAVTDNTSDFGQPSNNRVRNAYIASETLTRNITLQNGASSGWMYNYNGAGTAGAFDPTTEASIVNFERGVNKWVSNVYRTGTEATGTGTLRPYQLVGSSVAIGTAGAPFILAQSTVATLPAVSTNVGAMVEVTDSSAITTEGQTCVGGGAIKATAISNGTVWKCF